MDLTLSPWAMAHIVIFLLGFLNAGFAISYVRSPQGAVAWAACLLIIPHLALPLYWIFGPRRFYFYKRKLSQAFQEFQDKSRDEQSQSLYHSATQLPEKYRDDQRFFEAIAESKFTRGNSVQVYSTGKSYFASVLEEIERAKHYIFLQYYIVRSDTLGKEFLHKLANKTAQGVKVYLLYDQIGSFALSSRFTNSLREHGIQLAVFKTNRGVRNPFLLNFRNHRKIVVCDGKVGFIGGSNLGLEYREKTKRFNVWRDTDIRISGPALHGIQRAFLRDWYWATDQHIQGTSWNFEEQEQNLTSLSIHTGPSSKQDEATLLFMNLFTMAERRIWVATPYLVPDEGIVTALQLAALRGLDVRILLPAIWDHPLVSLATAYYARQISHAGVKVYRYKPGFMHQKVALIDDQFSLIGTKNLDNRSLQLNFEISLLTYSESLASQVEKVLEVDFGHSCLLDDEYFASESQLFVLITRFARLFSPVL
ncbi:MAG: cardiolipin synthase [Bdellovibrionales bacterium]|nr:cardiolipin synthase [Bdellovibrionales bacterium]